VTVMRTRMLPAVFVFLTAWSCGGSSRHPPRAPTASNDSQGEAARGTAPAAADQAPVAGPAITDAECGQLADHLVDVSVADRRSAPAEPYTNTDAEAAKRELRQSLRPACASLTRREFTCALAARSGADVRLCK
jgi:hypothetical protein